MAGRGRKVGEKYHGTKVEREQFRRRGYQMRHSRCRGRNDASREWLSIAGKKRGLIGRRFPRSGKGSLGNEKCCKQGLLRGSFNRPPRRPRGPVRAPGQRAASSVFVSFHLSVPNSTDNFFPLLPAPAFLSGSGLIKFVRSRNIYYLRVKSLLTFFHFHF